jgi:hypothetical protein
MNEPVTSMKASRSQSSLGNAIAFLSSFTLILSSQSAFAFSPSLFPHRGPLATATSLSTSVPSDNETFRQVTKTLSVELNELAECSSILFSYVFQPEREVTVEDVVLACDAVDGSAGVAVAVGEDGERKFVA